MASSKAPNLNDYFNKCTEKIGDPRNEAMILQWQTSLILTSYSLNIIANWKQSLTLRAIHNSDGITEWTNTTNTLSSNLKAVCHIRYEQCNTWHTWIRTTRLLTTYLSIIRTRNVCCYTSWQVGVLYDVAIDVSSILKMTGKRVLGDVDSA